MPSWLAAQVSAIAEKVASVFTKEQAPDLESAIVTAIGNVDPYDDQDPAKFRSAYKDMLSEPTVKAALFTKLFEVCALDFNIQPSDPDDPMAKDVAECTLHAITAMKGGSRALLTKVAGPALKYQFSISEVNLRVETRGRFAGKLVVDTLKSKNTRDGAWEFQLDEYKNILGLVYNGVNGKKQFDPRKFIHYRFNPEFENPRGMSDLRAAYRSWWIKTIIQRAMSVLGAKMGPVAVGHYENPASRPGLETQLEKLAARRWAAVPKDVQLELIDYMSQGAMNGYKQIFDYLDKQIFLGIRGAFLQSLEGDRTGARSMGEVHESTADLFVWFLSCDLADHLTSTLVDLLVGLNYGPDVERPTVKIEAAVQEDVKTLTEIAQGAQALGLELSKKELYERFGFNPPIDEEDALAKSNTGSIPFGLEDDGKSFDDLMRDGDEPDDSSADGEAVPTGIGAVA